MTKKKKIKLLKAEIANLKKAIIDLQHAYLDASYQLESQKIHNKLIKLDSLKNEKESSD